MSYEIRAMSFAEIMDAGFRIVSRHFGLILGISAALYVPVPVLVALITPHLAPGRIAWATVGAGRLGFVIGLGLYTITVSPRVAAGVTFAIGAIYLGPRVSVGQALDAGTSVLLPIIGASL